MKKSEFTTKIRMSKIKQLAYAFLLIRIRKHFKLTEYIFNDLTLDNSGVHKLDLNRGLYHDKMLALDWRFIYCAGIPVYDKKNRKFASRLKSGSVVTIGANGMETMFSGELWNVGEIKNKMVSVQSKSDITLTLRVSIDIIKSVIK